MCTLTYLPLPGGFAVVSSRDEQRARGAMQPPVRDADLRAVYPVDDRSGGTWFLTSAAGFTLSLLNGGHARHRPGGPYRHSRGLVPLLFARAGGLSAFLHTFDPDGLEPFTLVAIDHAGPAVTLLVWTGHALERLAHDQARPGIWSSSTLYDEAMRAEREVWFRQALKGPDGGSAQERQMRFHHEGGMGSAPPDRTIRMHRPGGLETVCITQHIRTPGERRMLFHDLLNDDRCAVDLGE